MPLFFLPGIALSAWIHAAKTVTASWPPLGGVANSIPNQTDTRRPIYPYWNLHPLRYAEDADHVAVAVVHKMDMVVSWNFKHLVNVHREKGFNAVNLLQGYPPVSIVNPLELIYD
jgi:hypothetical protein